MNKIVCVYERSDKFNEEHVYRLQNAVFRHTSVDHIFMCLSNEKLPYVDIVKPLRLGLKGWWNKMELFNTENFHIGDNITYIDLDTVIKGNIDDIVATPGFYMLKDFYTGRQASGIMKFVNCEWGFWEGFKVDAKRLCNFFYGDQNYLEGVINKQYKWDFLQDRFDGIVSYKAHGRQEIIGSRIVCFHGEPWIQNVEDPLIVENWR